MTPADREPSAAQPRPGRPPTREPSRDPEATPTPASLAAMTTAIHDTEPEEPAPDDREAERGLRGLVGGGSSQVNVAAAMRARDATRPTADDLANAETNLVIIRRGWTPPPGTGTSRPKDAPIKE
jgi:hypothetical protein